MHTFASPRVLIRPAIASDRADVLEFTKQIWEGQDYIAYVWDDWYRDSHGILAVAEYGGRAVGMGKLTHLSQGQWWLEGLRVDPAHQGLKIGTQLHVYLQDWWEKNAGGTVRLMTSWERVEVQHLCERFGWTKVGEVKTYMGPSLGEPPPALSAASPGDLDEALRFALNHLEHSRGLADLDWQVGAVDEELLRAACDRGDLLWWSTGGNPRAGLAGVWPGDEDGQAFLGVAFVACEPGSMADLLMDLRRMAAQRGLPSLSWRAPALPGLEAALVAAGLVSRWEGSAYLYEKKSGEG